VRATERRILASHMRLVTEAIADLRGIVESFAASAPPAAAAAAAAAGGAGAAT
jgi:hypothetical protein